MSTRTSFTLHITFQAQDLDEARERAMIYSEALGVLRPEVGLFDTSLSGANAWRQHELIFCGHAGPDGEECARASEHDGAHHAIGIGAPAWSASR